MKMVQKHSYKNYIKCAKTITSNQVYPLSIAEGSQTGDIFTDGERDILKFVFLF